MGLIERWGFCGPTAELSSLNVEAERTINFYPVKPDSGTPKKTPTLFHTPGMQWWQTLGDQPCRALFEQDDRAFAVVGKKFYEVFHQGTATFRGNVTLGDSLCTIQSNGSGGGQLLVIAPPKGYVYDLAANTLTLILDADFPLDARQGAFQDGYGIVLDDSNQFWTSTLEDFSTWDALDVNQRSQVSDRWRAIVRNHREIWLFGEHTTNIYTDTGDADTPFQPVAGVLIEQGIIAPDSAQQFDNSVVWLGRGPSGAGVLYRANGYTPERISTHSTEYFWQQSAELPRAKAWTYEQEGHHFYVLEIPDLETSWVYDGATQLWHERALWAPLDARWYPTRARCHMYAFGMHIVGDRVSGGLYQYRLDHYTDQLCAAVA